MNKFKSFLFAFAFVIALAGAFAFNIPDKSPKTLTTFFYTSESMEYVDLVNVENWDGEVSAGGCDEDYGTIPCAITPTGDLGEFLIYLGSPEAIVTASDTKRFPAP